MQGVKLLGVALLLATLGLASGVHAADTTIDLPSNDGTDSFQVRDTVIDATDPNNPVTVNTPMLEVKSDGIATITGTRNAVDPIPATAMILSNKGDGWATLGLDVEGNMWEIGAGGSGVGFDAGYLVIEPPQGGPGQDNHIVITPNGDIYIDGWGVGGSGIIINKPVPGGGKECLKMNLDTLMNIEKSIPPPGEFIMKYGFDASGNPLCGQFIQGPDAPGDFVNMAALKVPCPEYITNPSPRPLVTRVQCPR